MASAWGQAWSRHGINRFGSSWGFTPEVVLIERYDIMGSARTAIQDFSTANPIYARATVTAWTVDNGQKSSIKASLYAALSGSTLVANPQTLDAYGKFRQPVYIQEPVILTITGLGNTPDHDTGILTVAQILSGTGTPEGAVTADIGTAYLRSDGGAGTTLYIKESGNGTNTGWAAK